MLRLPPADYIGCILADAIFGIVPLIYYLCDLSDFVYLSLASVAVSAIAIISLFIFSGKQMRTELERRFHL